MPAPSRGRSTVLGKEMECVFARYKGHIGRTPPRVSYRSYRACDAKPPHPRRCTPPWACLTGRIISSVLFRSASLRHFDNISFRFSSEMMMASLHPVFYILLKIYILAFPRYIANLSIQIKSNTKYLIRFLF